MKYSMKKLVKYIESKFGMLTGILHIAGINNDNFIINKSLSEFSSTLKPKVQGTYYIDKARAHCKLDFFALFSSFTGVMGNIDRNFLKDQVDQSLKKQISKVLKLLIHHISSEEPFGES